LNPSDSPLVLQENRGRVPLNFCFRNDAVAVAVAVHSHFLFFQSMNKLWEAQEKEASLAKHAC
jgi:hypothetical protein